MTDSELFLLIKNSDTYKTAGNDVQYCIFRSLEDKRVYLMFQETRSPTDWKVNLDFPCRPYKHQNTFFLVHRGYANTWKTCNDLIMKEFISACNLDPEFTPTVIGWSYGGAMAVLAAEDFNFRTGIKPDITTFGAPKILYFLRTTLHFKKSMNVIKQYCQINDFTIWCIPFLWVHHVKIVWCGKPFNLIDIIKNTPYNHCHYDEAIDLY